MKGITIGLLVAAGVASLWAAQRATATRNAPADPTVLASRPPAQPAPTETAIPPATTSPQATTAQDPIDPRMVKTPKGDIDPRMVKTPKGDIDPKMVVNPPPPRSPDDKTALKPRADH